jgi:hypothetical protein
VIVPRVTSQQSLLGLPCLVLLQRGDRALGQLQRSLGLLGLRVAMGTDRTPVACQNSYKAPDLGFYP